MIREKPHVIAPKIIFGAKAFHFSNDALNEFKAITKNHLKNTPNGSKVMVSFGEIDCRANEGIIEASEKSGKSLNEITDATVEGYIDWFWSQNKISQHLLYFFNVPAPAFDWEYSKDVNNKVTKVVAMFNSFLLKKCSKLQLKAIDVYSHTVNEQGFSNGLYHCDNRHLDNRTLHLIQEQLNQT